MTTLKSLLEYMDKLAALICEDRLKAGEVDTKEFHQVSARRFRITGELPGSLKRATKYIWTDGYSTDYLIFINQSHGSNRSEWAKGLAVFNRSRPNERPGVFTFSPLNGFQSEIKPVDTWVMLVGQYDKVDPDDVADAYMQVMGGHTILKGRVDNLFGVEGGEQLKAIEDATRQMRTAGNAAQITNSKFRKMVADNLTSNSEEGKVARAANEFYKSRHAEVVAKETAAINKEAEADIKKADDLQRRLIASAGKDSPAVAKLRESLKRELAQNKRNNSGEAERAKILKYYKEKIDSQMIADFNKESEAAEAVRAKARSARALRDARLATRR